MQTSQYQGTKLREAREARGLTQSALADIAGIIASRISHYEQGRHYPDQQTAADLADKLNIPIHFFYRLPRQETNERQVFWRSKLAAKAAERNRVSRRFDWLLDTYRFLDQQIQLPDAVIPSIDRIQSIEHISDDMIEDAADNLREHWNLGRGPISNLVSVMEAHGCITSVQTMNDDYLDAFSEWNPSFQRPFIFLGADKTSYARRLFSASHELGHMILHRFISPKEYESKRLHSKLEKQADLFASCFLLPAETFTADIYSVSLDALRGLKHTWLVSISAMIMRLHHLEIIDDKGKQRAFMQMSRRKWRKQEPGDEPTSHDQPRLTESAFKVLMDSGLFSPDAIEHQIGISTRDIESVTGLPPGFLRHEPENPYKLQLVR